MRSWRLRKGRLGELVSKHRCGEEISMIQGRNRKSNASRGILNVVVVRIVNFNASVKHEVTANRINCFDGEHHTKKNSQHNYCMMITLLPTITMIQYSAEAE